MSEPKYFQFSKEDRDLAETKGFTFEMRARWLLVRKIDNAYIWPAVDAYISAFMREGIFVKHKKFRDTLKDALNRKFGDKNVESISTED